MKYVKPIGFILAIVLAGVIYTMIPTQSKIIEGYQRELATLSGAIEQARREREVLKARDIELSWSINQDKARIEILKLCIEAKTMECEWWKKEAMLRLIPEAHATLDTEHTEDDVKANLMKPSPTTVNKVDNGKITQLYANNPGSPLEECKDFTLDPKRIVLHYTATPSTLTADQIIKSHLNKWGLDHYAGYHYIIDDSGRIWNTRPEECNALAEPKANHDAVHIAYIGNDKPNKDQLDSIVWLTKDVSKRLNIPIKNVTAHADVAAKNHKESMEYMFGGYDTFQKMIRLTQTITRDGKQMDALTYAWHAWWDMDFILTIQTESQFKPDAKWDIGNPWPWQYSFGYCQYNTHHQSLWYNEYKNLKTYQEQLNHCHEKYVYASTLPWWVWSRFHGYNVRMKNKDRFVIQ